MFNRKPIVMLGATLSVLATAHAAPKPPGTQATQKTEIQIAILLDLIQPTPGETNFAFVSIEGKDPGAALLKRLAKPGVVVKPGSKAKWKSGQVIDSATGKRGTNYTVGKFKWLSPTKAEAEGSKVYANLGGNGSKYRVTWDGKAWKAAKTSRSWIS